MKTLFGHTSPETAYVVDDYPYGFRLRCKIRYWLEHRAKHGFRFVSQTTNPKKPGEVWNKPSAGTYTPLAVMITDDIGHVRSIGLSLYDLEHLEGFVVDHAEGLGDDDHQKAVKYLRAVQAMREMRKRVVEACQ